MIQSKHTIAVPPGATIREQLADRDMSQKEFASRMGLSQKHISQLINGEVRLTPDVAVRLESVLGIPAQFWNNLEAIYQEKLIKAKEENDMDEDIELAKHFPYSEMANHGWVPKATRVQDKVMNLRKFFEVARLLSLENQPVLGIARRQLSTTEKSDYAFIAWVQKAKLDARNVSTSPINLGALAKSIPDIRRMTTMDPSDFCPKLIEQLSNCGVALIFLPHTKGSFLHGAAFYDGKKIVVGVTVRGKDADRFWFSLFHELGHILLGHIGQKDGPSTEDEKDADNFAAETLIPQDKFNRFVGRNDFSEQSIIDFSDYINIDVGIVVGRLQKEGFIQYTQHNGLKTKYIISS